VSDYYLFSSVDNKCLSDKNVYTEFIEPQSFFIDIEEQCEKVVLNINTTGSNYSAKWWNGDITTSTSIDTISTAWVEITDVNNCKTADTAHIEFKSFIVENINFSHINSDCWED